jgi:hypothetical protein
MARVFNEILAYSYVAAFMTGIVVLAAATFISSANANRRSVFLRRRAWPAKGRRAFVRFALGLVRDMTWKEAVVIIVVLTVALGGVWVVF